MALRLLSELHHELNHPLHVVYTDIKAAFDSADRIAPWKALRTSGTPRFLQCWNWPKRTGGSDVEMFEILHRD